MVIQEPFLVIGDPIFGMGNMTIHLEKYYRKQLFVLISDKPRCL